MRAPFRWVVAMVAVLTGVVTHAASPTATGPRAVLSDRAPKPVGPYSQGIVAGGFLFLAGQTPTDPATGNLISGTLEQSTDRVLDNLAAVLAAEGLSFADVVKVTAFLVKPDDFAAFNAAYGKRLGEAKPARSTVFVVALPKGAPLEVDMVAVRR